jgi:hypothetical protein
MDQAGFFSLFFILVIFFKVNYIYINISFLFYFVQITSFK